MMLMVGVGRAELTPTLRLSVTLPHALVAVIVPEPLTPLAATGENVAPVPEETENNEAGVAAQVIVEPDERPFIL